MTLPSWSLESGPISVVSCSGLYVMSLLLDQTPCGQGLGPNHGLPTALVDPPARRSARPEWTAVNAGEYVVLGEAHQGLEGWQEKHKPMETKGGRHLCSMLDSRAAEAGSFEWKAVIAELH